MKMDRPVKIVLAAAMLGVLVLGLATGSLAQGSKAGPILKPNPEMDKRTVIAPRSEERRVGKECRSRWSPYH